MQEWFTVNRRVIQNPPEYHALRDEKVRKERELFEKQRYDKARRLGCGCVIALEHGVKVNTVHYCPNHWAERKNRYAAS